jgi:hypothetical protein
MEANITANFQRIPVSAALLTNLIFLSNDRHGKSERVKLISLQSVRDENPTLPQQEG